MAFYIVPMKAARLLEASTRSSTISGYGRFVEIYLFLDSGLTIFFNFLVIVSSLSIKPM